MAKYAMHYQAVIAFEDEFGGRFCLILYLST